VLTRNLCILLLIGTAGCSEMIARGQAELEKKALSRPRETQASQSEIKAAAGQAPWGNKDFTEQAIRKNQVFMGMTQDQVRTSWGEPTNINRTVTPNGIVDEWIYQSSSRVQHIYFSMRGIPELGIVTSMRESR
jgi:hypothetical protein